MIEVRTIDADALQERLKKKKPDPAAPRYVDGFNDALMRFKSMVHSAPTIKPELKKGKWIPVDSFSAFGGDEELWMAHGNPVAFYYCSNCKEQAYAGEDGQSLITDFCPNCGADLRGE